MTDGPEQTSPGKKFTLGGDHKYYSWLGQLLKVPELAEGVVLPPEFQAVLKQAEKTLGDLNLGVTPRQFRMSARIAADDMS